MHSHKHSCRSNPPRTGVGTDRLPSRPVKTGRGKGASQLGSVTAPVCAEQSLPKPQCSPNHSIHHCRNDCRRHIQTLAKSQISHAQPTLRKHDADGHDSGRNSAQHSGATIWGATPPPPGTQRHTDTHAHSPRASLMQQSTCGQDAAPDARNQTSLEALVPSATAPPAHLSTGRTCSKEGTARDAATRPVEGCECTHAPHDGPTAVQPPTV